jgi:hypothetical protein
MTIEGENQGIQSGAEPLEFILMGTCQFVEYFYAVCGEGDVHLATVFGTGYPADQFLRGQTVDQSYGTVVRDLQLFSKFSNGRGVSAWKAFNGQESLVLPRS